MYGVAGWQHVAGLPNELKPSVKKVQAIGKAALRRMGPSKEDKDGEVQ